MLRRRKQRRAREEGRASHRRPASQGVHSGGGKAAVSCVLVAEPLTGMIERHSGGGVGKVLSLPETKSVPTMKRTKEPMKRPTNSTSTRPMKTALRRVPMMKKMKMWMKVKEMRL